LLAAVVGPFVRSRRSRRGQAQGNLPVQHAREPLWQRARSHGAELRTSGRLRRAVEAQVIEHSYG
jgi:hypothetical protein